MQAEFVVYIAERDIDFVLLEELSVSHEVTTQAKSAEFEWNRDNWVIVGSRK